MKLTITDRDYPRLKEYIETQCGIVLRDSQKYLVESRLSGLIREQGCGGFADFCNLILRNNTKELREKIVNAMTTNETLWFRDNYPWQSFKESLLPKWDQTINDGGPPPRIWSAAASTGQEAYSMAMLIAEHCKTNRSSVLQRQAKIIGTDISTAALYVAISGNYDGVSMLRGFTDQWLRYKTTYFTQRGRVWEINAAVKKMVQFQNFNLQNSFSPLGKFDLICLRNVIIYFSDEFKRSLFAKIEHSLTPGGYLLLGGSETPLRYTERFQNTKLGNSTFYRLKE